MATEYTRNLQPLLNAFGNDRRFRLILFTLDEATYAPRTGAVGRALPPPSGSAAPWWFHDSLNGMRRFFDSGDGDRRNLQHSRIQRRHAVPSAPSPLGTTCGGAQRATGWPGWSRVTSLMSRMPMRCARALAYDLTKITYRL
ncbi:MAG: hypothetical protein KatS3mg052_2286 [Candidatus Roseilinea sp.]|nr:MAG: hypothetical protein KatS3mg052_2286 [Candidatus Roseilinea sp.]